MNDEEKEIFEKYADCTGEMHDLTEREAFVKGFTLPNEIFHFRLSSGAISVYAFLLRCENRTTYECYPSYSTIGKAVGMSKNTVRKYVKGLESAGLIEIEHTTVTLKDGTKRNGKPIYRSVFANT